MSWDDYTHARHFGGGIYRPYSDFIADIVLAFDNLIADEPGFAHSVVPFHTRDTIFVFGERLSFLAISRQRHRHYPLFGTWKWAEYWTVPEEQPIAADPSCLERVQEFNVGVLVDHLKKDFWFVDPFVIAFPSVFQPKARTPEAQLRADVVAGAAKLLWSYEHRHYQDALEMEKPKEIFLSHKSVDKVLVREIANTLAAIGFAPWLDEDKMKAGTNLERGIRAGFTSSCAAVFFITPDFKDDGFLATEIDYALAEKRAKGDRFQIIPLRLKGPDGRTGEVPEMIRQYVWKPVEPVEIIRTIVEALPIKMDRVVWRK